MDYTALVEAINGIADLLVPIAAVLSILLFISIGKFFTSLFSKDLSKSERKIYQERISLLENELVDSEQRYNKRFAQEIELKHTEENK